VPQCQRAALARTTSAATRAGSVSTSSGRDECVEGRPSPWPSPPRGAGVQVGPGPVERLLRTRACWRLAKLRAVSAARGTRAAFVSLDGLHNVGSREASSSTRRLLLPRNATGSRRGRRGSMCSIAGGVIRQRLEIFARGHSHEMCELIKWASHPLQFFPREDASPHPVDGVRESEKSFQASLPGRRLRLESAGSARQPTFSAARGFSRPKIHRLGGRAAGVSSISLALNYRGSAGLLKHLRLPHPHSESSSTSSIR